MRAGRKPQRLATLARRPALGRLIRNFRGLAYLSVMLKSPYQPCIPTRGSQVPTGPDWVHEIKHDGFRLIVQREGDRVRLFTRNGYDWSERYPLIKEAAGQLRAAAFVLDGEAVILRDNGLADFDALRSKRHDHEARLVAFDLLAIDGEDIRTQPLHARKARLAKLLGGARSTGSPGIQLSEHMEGGIGPEMFEHACKLGLEGIVSKRMGSAYTAGPTSNWIKIKNPVTSGRQNPQPRSCWRLFRRSSASATEWWKRLRRQPSER